MQLLHGYGDIYYKADMKDYRRIWKKVNGEIPIDEFGRRFEIHHLDGNRNNNDISNLVCLPIEEHFQLHLQNGDYAAAFRISQRMQIDPELKSKLASLSNQKRLQEDNHPFKDPEIRKKGFNQIQKRVQKGIQGLQNSDIRNKAIQAKKEKYTKEDLSTFAKKGWNSWKESNVDAKQRTIKGSVEGVKKTKNTNWYHKPDGQQLRATPNDPRLNEGWIKGRFNGKELSRKANLSKFTNKN